MVEAAVVLVALFCAGMLGYYLGAVRYGLTSEDVGNHDAEVYQRGWADGYSAAMQDEEDFQLLAGSDAADAWYARRSPKLFPKGN